MKNYFGKISQPDQSRTNEIDQEYAHSRVKGNRKNFWQMLVIMVGFTYFSPSMTAGGHLGLGLNLSQFIIAVILGNLFLAIYTGCLAYIGQHTGMNLDLLARQTFGSKGAHLASFIIGITQTGWFGVGVAMFAIPVAAFYHLNVYLLVLIMGFLMTLTSVKGIKALSIFGIIAVPLITVLGFYSVYLSFHTSGSLQNMFSNHPLKPLSMAMALSIVIGNFISGGTSTPNFTRFSKNSIGAISATVIAFFVGNIFMFIFGATGAAAFGKADIFDTLIMQGLAIPAILSLGLNIWSTNNNALYASGISLANITNNSMKLMTMIAGTIGTLLSIFLFEHFTTYLSLLSSLIPPIGSIIVVDYFMHRSNYKTEECPINYNLSALCPIFIGAFVGCVIKIGIPPINSLIAAIISYLLLQYIKINK